jgi:DegV family protein with EDD domain
MAGVAVLTDSTSSLSPGRAQSAGVSVIALQVVVDEVSRSECHDDVTADLVARALRAGRTVTTSRPSPEAFSLRYVELAAAGYDAVVSVHLSRALSATCEAATMAAEAASIPVTVVDSTTIAMATGFAVLSGAAAAATGSNAAEVAAVVRRRASAATTYFYVDTLDYLRHGGRIGAAAALMGTALSVKPLLTVTKGTIRPHERVRTASKALVRLEDLAVAAFSRAAAGGGAVDVAVHHLDNSAGAQALADRLRERLPGVGDLITAEVSAVLGAHVGPGTLGIVVSPR